MSDLCPAVVVGPAAGLQSAAAERRPGGLLLLPPQAAASVQLSRHPQLRRYAAVLHNNSISMRIANFDVRLWCVGAGRHV